MTTVIYHSADYDGIFCREIAKKFMPEAILIGWNFGDPKVTIKEGDIYILDLSPDCLNYVPGDLDRVIWIDHHKTSIEKWPSSIAGYRIDGVAACRLAWQWFAAGKHEGKGTTGGNPDLPTKEDYVNRTVYEPLAVKLAGEYDIWDKRDWRPDTFQYGLRLVDNGSDFWEALLQTSEVGVKAVLDLLENGSIVQRYSAKIDADICKSRTWLMEWEGLRFLCINSARFNSLTFKSVDHPETGHDALLGFTFNGKLWTVSLYHANHNTAIDLSAIAKKYNGGGHRGACGFTCQKLPFMAASQP